MALRARTAIRAMPGYVPPREGRTGLRLDFNENTAGCSPKVLEALRASSSEDLARYPEYTGAERDITAAFGHTPDTALLTNGVDDAIWLAVVTFLDPGDEAIIVSPTFAMYRFYCQQAQVAPVAVGYIDREIEPGPGPAEPQAGRAAKPRDPRPSTAPRPSSVREFVWDGDAVRRAVTPRTRAVFIASPNNPTGTYTPEAELLRLARALPEVMIFADEAYADFVEPGHRGLLDAVGEVPNLVVARTFSKAYGLAGARLGCLFAHPAQVSDLRKAHSPYNVNTLAMRCGLAALADKDWAMDYCRQAIAGRGLIEETLAGLGVPYWRGRANFVLFESGERTDALIAGLRRRGVLIRDRRADWPGTARMSCGTEEQTRRGCAALVEVWEELS